jgi:hypothetical protein
LDWGLEILRKYLLKDGLLIRPKNYFVYDDLIVFGGDNEELGGSFG